MAEWSKAPDSRIVPSPNRWWEHSGPRMWAWVRIPLLTAFYFLFFFVIRIDQKSASAGNRTPINCLEGNYASHYTTNAYESLLFNIFSSMIWWQLQVATKMRQQGIEPRSTAWKATMLTITPLTPDGLGANSNILNISYSHSKSSLHIATFRFLFVFIFMVIWKLLKIKLSPWINLVWWLS